MILHPTGKSSTKPYINRRNQELGTCAAPRCSEPAGLLTNCLRADGKTIDYALNDYRFQDDSGDGKWRKYNYGDLKYDIKTGYIQDPR